MAERLVALGDDELFRGVKVANDDADMLQRHAFFERSGFHRMPVERDVIELAAQMDRPAVVERGAAPAFLPSGQPGEKIGSPVRVGHPDIDVLKTRL